MPPDLVILLCDTARADAFSPWGAAHPTPTMERLCREGISYADAVCQAPWTVPSTASIMSGRLPTEHGITGECFDWIDRKPTSPAAAVRACSGPWLPETLGWRGYATWGASCNTWVSAWGGFDRGFEEFHDLRPWARPRGPARRAGYRARKAFGLVDRGGREAVARFRRRLAQTSREPLFAFVNLMETHAPLNPPRPYYPYPFWRRRRTNRLAGGPDQGLSMNAGVVEPAPGYVRTLRALYAASARYEDRVLSGFVKAVKRGGRPTVMAVVADHGEHLGEHGLFNHNSSLGQPLLHVPLVVWGSKVDLAAERIEGPVSLLGLADWFRGLADGNWAPIRPGPLVISEYEGTAQHNGIPEQIAASIRDRRGEGVPDLVLNPGVSIRKGSLKYVATGNGSEALYDLSTDPAEDHDLLPDRTDASARFFRPLREQWEHRRAAMPSYAAGDVAGGEIEDHLRVLGYIE